VNVAHVWTGDSGWASLARAALTPFSLAYRGVVSVRNGLYDSGTLPVVKPAIPVLSVGNLAAGGTGKTPVAGWIAGELKARGAHPSIVMRGYGDDEPQVHRVMNPGVPVVVNSDRVQAVRQAAESGSDVAVLDDGFQHRRIWRSEDVVLVSADQWTDTIRLLPAGPWREPLSSLARSSLALVTRKAADPDQAALLMRRLAALTHTGTGAVAALVPGDLRHAVTGEVRPLSDIRGTRVLVAAGIGDPVSLAAQLQQAGARVELRRFPDHHRYVTSDIDQLARESRSFDFTLCTLKDSVKLGPRWPREAPPLWYVSLRCEIEVGGAEVSALLDRVLAARSTQIR
jgi:tetraacyldisaccharide 4'-kinase